MPRAKKQLKPRPLPGGSSSSSAAATAGSMRQRTLEETMHFCDRKSLIPETDSDLSGEDDVRVESGPVCVGTNTPPRRSSRTTIVPPDRRREAVESPYNSSQTSTLATDVDSADEWCPMREEPDPRRKGSFLDSDEEEEELAVARASARASGSSRATARAGAWAGVAVGSSGDDEEEELAGARTTARATARARGRASVRADAAVGGEGEMEGDEEEEESCTIPPLGRGKKGRKRSRGEGEEEESSTVPPVGSVKRGRKQSRGAARGRAGRSKGAGRGGNSGVPAADPWKEENNDFFPRDIPFTADPGPRNAAAALDSEEPVDFLELFLNEEILEHIVTQTNLYAEQCIAAMKTILPHARHHSWKPIDLFELKTFLGLHFLTAVVHKPELEMYWSTEEIVATPFFSKTMSRNRFQLIWRFLHFIDNSIPIVVPENGEKDKMFKIRPVLDFIVSKFRDMYQPHQNISIDEGTLLFRGRLNFKVYNPQKPVKYGIKSYILCDSENGYCFNMRPYCGEYIPLVDTVVFLLDGLAGSGHRLFMDNFYNSVGMCDKLLSLQTHVCGTLRLNRGEPPFIRQLTNADLGVGDVVARHNDKVMVLAWRDKSIVRMVSTFHQNEQENVTVWQRGKKKGDPSVRVDKSKPSCIVSYNKSMNGVDRMDQNITYYPFVRKSQKWTNKFVAYLFEMAMFNAFVIYRAKHPQGEFKCLLSFMKSVITSWTRPKEAGEEEGRAPPPHAEAPRAPRAPFHDPQCRMEANLSGHVLEQLPPTPGCKGPRRRCRVCTKSSDQRSETRWYCKRCKVPMHPGECYAQYHSNPHYSAH